MNFIFRLFLTLSALSLFVSIYLVNSEIVILSVLPPEKFDEHLNDYLNYMMYVFMPFIFSYIGIILSKKLGVANLGNVQFIETANNDFLSNYLAFFFVALSLNNWVAFIFCFGLTALFTFYSRVSYFNPILLLFGYGFYYVNLDSSSKVMVITKQKIKSPTDIDRNKQYKRINNYTFMD